MGQGLLEAPHQGFPLVVFRRHVAGAGVIIGHGGDHHHAVAGAPDFHLLDTLGMDVVHDYRPHPVAAVKPLIFRDFGGVIHQIQREAQAAAHFLLSGSGFLYKSAVPRRGQSRLPSCVCIRPTMSWWRWTICAPETSSMTSRSPPASRAATRPRCAR